jgi:uncharacterized protein (TIGR02246 family)
VRTRYLMSLLMLLVALAGCTRTDRTAEEATIRAADARWLAAAQAHDLERTLSYWTEDVIMMQPGAPEMVGKEAVRRYVSEAFSNPSFSITWVTDRVWVSKGGDLAYAIGADTIRMTSPDGKSVVENNKAVAVWRKEPDGVWRCAVDIWNAADDGAGKPPGAE